MTHHLPLAYACSGCSSAAQMANFMALELDRWKIAEMSCISGVGGDVPALVKVATSGRPIIAIDGCPLECARSCLARHSVAPTVHFKLHDHNVRKRPHCDFDREEAARMLEALLAKMEPCPSS